MNRYPSVVIYGHSPYDGLDEVLIFLDPGSSPISANLT